MRNLDETTLGGYLNEISLLRQFSNSDQIIRLLDAEINRERGYLNMLMEFGEADLSKLLKQREGKPIDHNFIRYSWQQVRESLDFFDSPLLDASGCKNGA